MAIKIYKPTSPARRQTSVIVDATLVTKRPERKLRKIKKKKGGRNSSGRITVRHRGGGAKQFYRLVDYRQDKLDMPATVEAIEYDPNRSARLALVRYSDGEKRYIIAPAELMVGGTVIASKERAEVKPGNRMPLSVMPLGVVVYNIELTPGKGGQLVRGAGLGAKLMAVEGNYATIKLPSTEVRMVPKEAMATIGQVSNSEAMHVRVGKAGRNRHRGIRPSVRGKAMNPVDHPHGGGEGNTPIGLKGPKTPWGKYALGVVTRKRTKYSDKLIINKRRNKRLK